MKFLNHPLFSLELTYLFKIFLLWLLSITMAPPLSAFVIMISSLLDSSSSAFCSPFVKLSLSILVFKIFASLISCCTKSIKFSIEWSFLLNHGFVKVSMVFFFFWDEYCVLCIYIYIYIYIYIFGLSTLSHSCGFSCQQSYLALAISTPRMGKFICWYCGFLICCLENRFPLFE